MVAGDRQHEAQARYRHKRRGITDRPIASLYRGWHTFGALLIVQDTLTPDMLVVRWLCRDVDEQTAREAINDYNRRAVS